MSIKELIQMGLKRVREGRPLAIVGYVRRLFMQNIIYRLEEGVNYTISGRYFTINGKRYAYLLNRYNAVETERSVELPVAIDFLQERGLKKAVLEVGNVLNHYYRFEHEVLDKYEIAKGVINADVVDFAPDKRYDIIISISTLEHVGFDEPIREKGKVLKALERMRLLLNPEGWIMITVPLGYNPEIDFLVRFNLFHFSEAVFLKRVNWMNEWYQTDLQDAIVRKYGSKYPAANSLAILVYHNSSEPKAS